MNWKMNMVFSSIMMMQVLMAPLGAGQTEQVALDMFCGQGHQILRWLAYAACAQLAYKRGA
jgi:CRISPR/Cas system-associated endonuclease/helicase Cas3